jgi:hypothetical protein
LGGGDLALRRFLVWGLPCAAFIAALAYLLLYVNARRDCYTWANGELAFAEILLDCELETPLGAVIIGCAAAPLPALFPIESALACRYRDEHVQQFLTWAPESSNSLHRLASTHNLCTTHESLAEECSRAHLAAIDWLLHSGLDINSVAYGKQTALHIAARDLNSELFAQLLERGADPNFRPPDSHATTTVEEIRRHIREVDAEEFPEVVSTWELMLNMAANAPAAQQGVAADVE